MLGKIIDGLSWRYSNFATLIDERFFKERSQWVRHSMECATRDFVASLPCSTLKVLEVSGEKWSSFGFKEYRTIEYDEYDVCSGTLPESYDLIIIEQVLEHVLHPREAVKNLYSMVAPNGYLVVTTPFMVGIHHAPIDCSRWTELGMRQLLMDAGFVGDSMVTGSWGNRQCIKASFRRIPRFHPLFHSLENEPRFPQVVWAFAQKPSS
jgi:SAM-dependent methyltransferase